MKSTPGTLDILDILDIRATFHLYHDKRSERAAVSRVPHDDQRRARVTFDDDGRFRHASDLDIEVAIVAALDKLGAAA